MDTPCDLWKYYHLAPATTRAIWWKSMISLDYEKQIFQSNLSYFLVAYLRILNPPCRCDYTGSARHL